MSDRDELVALRRLAELEAKAGGETATTPERSPSGKLRQQVGNLAAGAVRGAGSIGATLLWPADKATDLIKGDRQDKLGPLSKLVAGDAYKPPMSRNEERRASMDEALGGMGADTDSFLYGAGKLAAEVAGTMGVGGTVANGVGRVAPKVAPALLESIRTGGMVAQGAGMGTRVAGGAVNGAASAGLVDPSNAGGGAAVGAVAPPAVAIVGRAGEAARNGLRAGAERLMQSAIKPTIAQLKSGDAKVAVNALLERGINPTEGGVNKLRALIDSLDDRIGADIAGSTATVDKGNVLRALDDTRSRFTRQVSPGSDLSAIQGVADDFLAHPAYPGQTIPVQAAQELKRGTYNVLAKKYGQLGSAETEAQKGLARGLKEEIAAAVPGIDKLNAEQAKLLTTLSVAERRALMEMNKNPMGLAALAQSPASWAMFMADKSALFKSLAARAVNATAGGSSAAGGNPALSNSMANMLNISGRAAPVAATQD